MDKDREQTASKPTNKRKRVDAAAPPRQNRRNNETGPRVGMEDGGGDGSITSKEARRSRRADLQPSDASASSSEEDEDGDQKETRLATRKIGEGIHEPRLLPKVITTADTMGVGGGASPASMLGGMSNLSAKSETSSVAAANDARKILERHVRKDLFPKVKMITNKKMLVFGGKIQQNVYTACVNEKQRPTTPAAVWWEDNKNQVRRTLNTRRNNVTEAIKKTFMKGMIVVGRE